MSGFFNYTNSAFNFERRISFCLILLRFLTWLILFFLGFPGFLDFDIVSK